MSDVVKSEILALTQKLLNAIAAGDWATYTQLCDPSLSAFEPEGQGHQIHGLPFHKFYFDGPKSGGGRAQTTICDPRVRSLGADAAVISYVRLVQRTSEAGHFTSTAAEETRVWQRVGGQWRHVHFHRSPAPSHG